LPKQSNMHATPVSTALGKRPLETPASSDSQPPTAKAPRLDTDILLATLEETAAALAKIGGEALSEEQIKRLSDVSLLFLRVETAHRSERKRVSERPVDEVMLLKTAEVAADGAPIFRPMELAPEMREGIAASLSPKQMGHVACVSRAWQAAVRAACATRLRVLQLELPYERYSFTLKPLTTELLARLEEQTAKAPALLKRLSDEDAKDLRTFEPVVIMRHIDLLEPHLRSFSVHSWHLLMVSALPAEWLAARVDLIIECATSGRDGAYPATVIFENLPRPVIEARIGDMLPALGSMDIDIRFELLETLQQLPRAFLAHIPGLRGHLAPLLGSKGRRLTGESESELARKVTRLLGQ